MTAEIIQVVTGFLMSGRELLILRRSAKMNTFPLHWGGVHGFLDQKDPLEQVKQEILEETGITEGKLKLRAQLEPQTFSDMKRDDRAWRVHSFLFEVAPGVDIQLDWENDDYLWVDPSHLGRFDTMPHFIEIFEKITLHDNELNR